MRKKAPHQGLIRTLEAAVLVTAVFDILLWHDLLMPDATKQASVIDLAAETVRTASAVDGSDIAPSPEPTGLPAAREIDIERAVIQASGIPAVTTNENVPAAAGGPVKSIARPVEPVSRPPAPLAGKKEGDEPGAGSAAHGGIGVPKRISIPSIALNAAVEKVALAPDGSMGVPRHPLDTAWFTLGPRPGETGSAAIAGHVDWMDGSTAVFAELHKLRPGDKVAVQDDGGATVLFVVRETRTYDATAYAPEVFSSNDGKAHLNMITCAGEWDKRAKRYTERLVVFADKETE